MISLTSDYVTGTGDPSPYLRLMAEAGFTHVHWCHQWRSDFLYADSEIEQIGRWLDEFGLKLNDVHGSEGIEKFWYAPEEYARLAGIELVKNRIDFTARLGGDAVVMHAYPPTVRPDLAPYNDFLFDQIRRSLDDLQAYAVTRGVRIALENLIDFAATEAEVADVTQAGDNAELLARLITAYPPEFLGFCFDSGHAILGRDRTDAYAPLFARLAVLHLHDNDGIDDQHLPVYDGAVKWEQLAGLIGASPYRKPLSFELSINHSGFAEPAPFLAYAMEGCRRFARQVEIAAGG